MMTRIGLIKPEFCPFRGNRQEVFRFITHRPLLKVPIQSSSLAASQNSACTSFPVTRQRVSPNRECESCKAKRYKAKQCGHEPCTCEKCKAKQCKGEPCNPTQSNPGAFNPELLMSMLKSQQQSPLFAMKEMLRFLQNPLPTLLRAFLFRRRRC